MKPRHRSRSLSGHELSPIPNPVCHLISDKRIGWRAAWGGVCAWRWARGRGRAIWFAVVMGVMPGLAAPSAGVPAAAAPAPVADIWSAKLPDFKADAALEGAPTVLFFTATWCGFCHQMERTTLSNASVRSRLEPFGRIKLDFDQQTDLVARYQITGVPAFVMVNARGEEIARLVGMTEPDPFRGWLEDGKTRAVEMAKATARSQIELKELIAQVSGGADEGWAKAKTRVFELAARGEAEAKTFALGQLAARAALEPSSLFDGLLHSDLAVRIAVAGVLRKQLGQRFVFDPWADEATRVRVVGDERFAMLADVSIPVEVEARFIEIQGEPPVEGALDVLIKAAGRPEGLTPVQLEAALAELEKRKGSPVVSPRVTVGSGNPARMVVGDEMRYPIGWEKKEGAGWVPAKFAGRTVGVELAVTPRVRANGTIELSLAPQATEFEGFRKLAEGETSAEATQPLTPVFVVRAAAADVRVPIGNTAVLRGGEPHRFSWTITGDLVTEAVSRTPPTTSWILVTAKIRPAKR